MTTEAAKGLEKMLSPHIVGMPSIMEKIIKQSAGKPAKPLGVILSGSPGVGKSTLAERFNNTIVFEPLSPQEIKDLSGRNIDKHARVPQERKEEAKAILGEMIDQGVPDQNQGLRGLGPVIEAIADAAAAPDMREALAEKYPVYRGHISMKSGERLAETFTIGTAGSTRALKPYRFKSRGVGFLSLN